MGDETKRANPLLLLDGFKTYIAAVGLIGLGVYLCTEGDVEKGLETIMAGLAVFGIGHKLEKARTQP